MAVIINEFEVIPEPAPQAAENQATTQQPPAAQNKLPQEVESVLRMQFQRSARVRAD